MSDKAKMYNDPLYKMTKDEKYGPSLTTEEIQQMKKENEEDTAAMQAALFSGLKKYGTMAVKYVRSNEYPDMTAFFKPFEEINAYGKSVDEQAAKLKETMEAQLMALPENALIGEYMHDLHVKNNVEQIIDEEIKSKLVYVTNF